MAEIMYMNNNTETPGMEDDQQMTTANTSSHPASPAFDEGLVSISIYRQFSFVSNIICVPTLCIIAIVTNSTVLVVLRSDPKQNNKSFYIYMSTLMVCHMLDSFVSLVRSIPLVIDIYNPPLGNFINTYMKRYTIYVNMLISHCTSGTIFMMSVERLTALLKPFTVKDALPSKHPRTILLTGFVFFVLYLLPFGLLFDTSSRTTLENNTEYHLKFVDGWDYFMYCYFYVETILLYFVAPISILLVNSAIPVAYFRIQKTNLSGIQLNLPRRRQQTKITTVVVCIVVLYLLMSVPHMLGQTLTFLDKRRQWRDLYFFVGIGNLITHFNSTCDCLIYIVISKRFWCTLKLICCKWLGSKSESMVSIRREINRPVNSVTE